MMKQSKSSTTPRSPPKPLNPQQFPLHAQTDSIAGRDGLDSQTRLGVFGDTKRVGR